MIRSTILRLSPFWFKKQTNLTADKSNTLKVIFQRNCSTEVCLFKLYVRIKDVNLSQTRYLKYTTLMYYYMESSTSMIYAMLSILQSNEHSN